MVTLKTIYMDKFLVIVYVYPNNELENVSFFEVNKKLQCAWREREREREGEREMVISFLYLSRERRINMSFLLFYFYISKFKIEIKGNDKNPYFVHNFKKTNIN